VIIVDDLFHIVCSISYYCD